MPLFFFDFTAGRDAEPVQDDQGFHAADGAKARCLALTTLADMARELVNDEHASKLSVSVREQGGPPFFEATLSLVGQWLPEVDA